MFERIQKIWSQWSGCLLLVTVLGAACSEPQPLPEDGLLPLRVGSFTFASLASVMAWVVHKKGFDRRHGLDVEIVPYGSVAAYYAGLTSGEVDTIAGGPLVFQRMRLMGVPIKITNTYASLASLIVLSSSPSVQSIVDLRGLRLAADMGSSEYQILRILGERKGIRLGSQVEVLQATPAAARAHLQSGEAQAILTFEPTATLVLREVPEARIISQAQTELREAGLDVRWLLVSMMREDWIEKHPEGPPRWRAALTDAADFVDSNPKEADAIFSQAMNFPVGVLAEALEKGRIEFSIRPASEEREPLRMLFNIAQETGFAAGLPGVEAFYEEP